MSNLEQTNREAEPYDGEEEKIEDLANMSSSLLETIQLVQIDPPNSEQNQTEEESVMDSSVQQPNTDLNTEIVGSGTLTSISPNQTVTQNNLSTSQYQTSQGSDLNSRDSRYTLEFHEINESSASNSQPPNNQPNSQQSQIERNRGYFTQQIYDILGDQEREAGSEGANSIQISDDDDQRRMRPRMQESQVNEHQSEHRALESAGLNTNLMPRPTTAPRNFPPAQSSRNLTISRLLQMYRNSRDQQNREQEIGENISYRRIPRNERIQLRPMVQNYMENTEQQNVQLRRGQIGRAAGYTDDYHQQNLQDNLMDIQNIQLPQQAQEFRIRNQFHLRSQGLPPRQSNLGSRHTNAINLDNRSAIEQAANRLEHLSTMQTLERDQNDHLPEYEGVREGQTSQFLRRRHELWVSRNLRHQRRRAGVGESNYYQGIRVRDIRRGDDFYSQEEALHRDIIDQEDRLNNAQDNDDILGRNNSESLHQRYLDIIYGQNSEIHNLNHVEASSDPHSRSNRQLHQIYETQKEKIPEHWRREELCHTAIAHNDNLVNFLENYGPLALLIYIRSQKEVIQSELDLKPKMQQQTQSQGIEQEQLDPDWSNITCKIKTTNNIGSGKQVGDMTSLSFTSFSNDYVKFIQRLLSFYSYNFKKCTSQDNSYQVYGGKYQLEAKKRLKKLITNIIPSCKELKRILTKKRRDRGYDRNSRLRFRDPDFPFDDENIIYIVTLKILESYHFEFSRDSTYYRHFIPLALEFYKHHANSSDLILVNSLIRYLHIYFPNLKLSKYLVTVEDTVGYFEQEKMKQIQHDFCEGESLKL